MWWRSLGWKMNWTWLKGVCSRVGIPKPGQTVKDYCLTISAPRCPEISSTLGLDLHRQGSCCQKAILATDERPKCRKFWRDTMVMIDVTPR